VIKLLPLAWETPFLESTMSRRPRRNHTPAFKAKVAGAEVDVKALHAKIGQLALENDFLESALTKAGMLSAKR